MRLRDSGAGRPSGWWPEALLLAGFVALTAALAAGALLGVDTAVSRWCFGHDHGLPHALARGLNFLGNGGPLTALAAVAAAWLGYQRRSVRPLLPVVAAFLLTGAVIVPLKRWTDRAAPRSTLADRVELFNPHLPPTEYADSYPSGHLVNTIVWYAILVLLLAPWLSRAGRRWLRVAPPAIVGVTTVFLNFHWFTDSVAGLLLGLLLARLLARVRWDAVPLPPFLGAWRRPAHVGADAP
ncbi:phosphatase PAP2 family protein [Rhizomonospora bruguierae]|uniref:phosphatase PAP2 family protein n=1 Tax=Rhizomonospora bruguierae TaxID=1581705 RepID=UPI001BCFDF11|nr:phosphatase PAP2 family protein [Micromonospora sp. NBRC 107566]